MGNVPLKFKKFQKNMWRNRVQLLALRLGVVKFAIGQSGHLFLLEQWQLSVLTGHSWTAQRTAGLSPLQIRIIWGILPRRASVEKVEVEMIKL